MNVTEEPLNLMSCQPRLLFNSTIFSAWSLHFRRMIKFNLESTYMTIIKARKTKRGYFPPGTRHRAV